MKKLILLLITLSLYACSKPKTVLICGDHVCINKNEANQYFEENLTLEVKIINEDKNQHVDLVQLNLKSNVDGNKEVNILRKQETKKKIRILSKDEIKKKKKEIKKNKIEVKNTKLIEKNKKKQKTKSKIFTSKKIEKNELTNICKTLDKCDIEEISDYLIKLSQDKKFPDITKRE